MSDLISRQDAIETSLEFFVEFLGGAFHENAQKELIARFQRLPFAEPKTKCVAQIRINRDDMEDLVNEKVNEIVDKMAEPKTGHWIFNPKDAIELMFTLPKCSECGFESADCGDVCSNCGAKMSRRR